jgi:hypothetical protein
MKRTVKMIALVATLLMATSSFAMMSLTDTSTVIGGGTFKPSTKVKLTSTATSSAYSAISGHEQGDKEFGTNNVDPKIYAKAKAKGVAATDCNTEAFDFSTWTSQ